MKKMAQIMILLSFILTGCESDVGMTVNVAWDDENYFTATGDWYLAAAVGSYIVDSSIAEDTFDQEAVTAGEDVTVNFSTSGGGDMYTAFIYLDVDADGSYTEGTDNITDYVTEWIDKNDEMTFELTPYYQDCQESHQASNFA